MVCVRLEAWNRSNIVDAMRENRLVMMLTHGRLKNQIIKDNTEPLDLKFKQSPESAHLASLVNSYKLIMGLG